MDNPGARDAPDTKFDSWILDLMKTMRHISDDELRAVVPGCSLFREVAERLDLLRPDGRFSERLSLRIKAAGIDTSHFKQVPVNKRREEDILTKRLDSREPGPRLREVLITRGRPYICVECGGGPKWCGRSLTLQVDHIDGDKLNNIETNLRFLCPNCHTQTANYGRTRKVFRYCIDCKTPVTRHSTHCRPCSGKRRGQRKRASIQIVTSTEVV